MDCVLAILRDVRPDLVVRRKHKSPIWEAAVNYLMRATSFKALKNAIGDELWFSPRDYIDIRVKLSQAFDTALGLKMAVISWLYNGYTSTKQAKTLCKENGLSEDNAIILTSIQSWASRPTLEKLAHKVDSPNADAVYYRDFYVTQHLKKVDKFLRYECNRKLTFIRNSNKMKKEDMEDEVRELLLYATYKVVPFITGDHLINFMKKSIHNLVLKRLAFYTTKKRQRLQGNGDQFGYTQTVESLSSTFKEGDEENHALMKHGATLPNTRVLLDLSIEKYIKTGPTGIGRMIDLLLLRGKEPDFVETSKKQANIRHVTDCEDVFDRVGVKRYYDLVAHYLCIPLQVVMGVVDDLRQMATV